MINGRNDSLALDDEDRLPWLEPAYDAPEDKSVSGGRFAMFIITGLVLIGLVGGGVYLFRTYAGGEGGAELIAAPQESYKIPAKDADAKQFEGEGHASYATSEGLDRGAKIDPSRLPEAPIIAGTSGATVPEADRAAQAAAPAKRVEAAVADRTGERSGNATTGGSSAAGHGAIQLGAYGSEALARDAWGRFSKRFDYLAELTHSIEPVTVGGSKFYRLRVTAGKNASTLCGKLKVAGENCMVVR